MSLDFMFWHSANLPRDKLAVFKEKQGGDVLDRILGSSARVLIHIEFGYFEPVAIIRCQLLQNRGYGAAWPTPRRPAIHQNRAGERKDLALKRPVRHIHWAP